MPITKRGTTKAGLVRRHAGPWTAALILMMVGWLSSALGQARLSPDYINPGILPSSARTFLFAMGDRIRRPGKERVTLTGKLSDGSGTVDVSLVWEVPGRFRLDRSDKPGRPLIYDGAWNTAAIPQPEADALESLYDDTSESFLYGMVQGVASRFLGNRFRADDGKTPNYSGPWYDVYEVFAPVRAPHGISKKKKVFRFDSQTGLLSRVDYISGPSVSVSTEISGWVNLNGQSHPGNIVRKVNGAAVMMVQFTSVSVGPSTSDGVFAGH